MCALIDMAQTFSSMVSGACAFAVGENMPSYWVSVVQLLGLNTKGNQIVSRFKLCHLKQIKLYYYFKHTFYKIFNSCVNCDYPFCF